MGGQNSKRKKKKRHWEEKRKKSWTVKSGPRCPKKESPLFNERSRRELAFEKAGGKKKEDRNSFTWFKGELPGRRRQFPTESFSNSPKKRRKPRNVKKTEPEIPVSTLKKRKRKDQFVKTDIRKPKIASISNKEKEGGIKKIKGISKGKRAKRRLNCHGLRKWRRFWAKESTLEKREK